MAVLWTSGRTALLLTLAAVTCAAAFVRRRFALATVLLLVALFSKEEAVLLPAILLGWYVVLNRREASDRRAVWMWVSVAGLAEVVYFVARSQTSAMTPFAAPSYYTPTFDVARLAANVVSYADRVATFPAIVALAALLLLGRPRPWLDDRLRRTLWCGLIWIAGGFALTIFAPIRSDLYACFPSVGACVIAAAFCAHAWRSSDDRRRRRALVAVPIAAMLLAPLYHARTKRWSDLAEFSTTTLDDLVAATASLGDDAVVVIHDDRSTRVNMSSAFGTLLPDAYRLRTGRTLRFHLDPPPPFDATPPPCAGCASLELTVRDGRLR
jgi:hypothetical protein